MFNILQQVFSIQSVSVERFYFLSYKIKYLQLYYSPIEVDLLVYNRIHNHAFLKNYDLFRKIFLTSRIHTIFILYKY